jgi:hypothetical protein
VPLAAIFVRRRNALHEDRAGVPGDVAVNRTAARELLYSLGRYDNGDRIPNAFENAASAGAAIVTGPWEASVRVRHLGPYRLIEDNSVRDSGSTIVNARAAWKGGHVQIYGEVLNIADSRDKDIAYYYESYLPAYDTSGPVEGRLSCVVEPRTFRMAVKHTL